MDPPKICERDIREEKSLTYEDKSRGESLSWTLGSTVSYGSSIPASDACRGEATTTGRGTAFRPTASSETLSTGITLSIMICPFGSIGLGGAFVLRIIFAQSFRSPSLSFEVRLSAVPLDSSSRSGLRPGRRRNKADTRRETLRSLPLATASALIAARRAASALMI